MMNWSMRIPRKADQVVSLDNRLVPYPAIPAYCTVAEKKTSKVICMSVSEKGIISPLVLLFKLLLLYN